MEKKKKQVAIVCISLAVLIAIFGILFVVFSPKGAVGAKNISIEVVHKDKSTKSVLINTDEEFLRGALEQEKGLVVGTESEFGLFITQVDSEKIDDSKKEWWCITKGGESVSYGVDQQPIADGEKYEITLTVGY